MQTPPWSSAAQAPTLLRAPALLRAMLRAQRAGVLAAELLWCRHQGTPKILCPGQLPPPQTTNYTPAELCSLWK